MVAATVAHGRHESFNRPELPTLPLSGSTTAAFLGGRSPILFSDGSIRSGMSKQLSMNNGDVDDAADDGEDFENHRLAGAEPATQPDDAPRDENDDPIFETGDDE